MLYSKTSISLAVAAVLLTVSAQIQLGLNPQLQPYLILIFIATIFEYNRNRLIVLFASKEALHSGKHGLARKSYSKYFSPALGLIAVSLGAAFYTKKEVLAAFSILGFLTFLYSGFGFGKKKSGFKLREIPYLKVFLIAFVWSASTILLPVIQADGEIFDTKVLLLFIERYFFIFSIAIQFDIRDMQADKEAGLKTIPLLINRDKSVALSYLSLLTCFLVSLFHYRIQNDWFIIAALFISLLTTYLFLKLNFFRNMGRYYYQILDVSVLFQGILVVGFYILNGN